MKSLFANNVLEVLAVLFLNREEAIHQSKIVTLSGLRVIQVQRALQRLSEAGLIEEYQQGNMVYYKLEQNQPILTDLKNILYKTILIAEPFKKAFDGEVVEVKFTQIGDSLQPLLVALQEHEPDAMYSPDLSFFIGGGMKKLQEWDQSIPVYGTYVAGLNGFEEVTKEVIYSHPDVDGDLLQYFAKQSLEALQDALMQCENKECVQQVLDIEQADIVFEQGD